MNCDKCGNEAKTKTIRGKDGRTFDGFECVSGCKNPQKPKYAYFFFGPREAKPAQNNGGGNGQAVNQLKEISETLKRIEKILANPKSLHVAQEEMIPDAEMPF